MIDHDPAIHPVAKEKLDAAQAQYEEEVAAIRESYRPPYDAVLILPEDQQEARWEEIERREEEEREAATVRWYLRNSRIAGGEDATVRPPLR